jgi:3-oxoacyl-[acyl-carrier-protein] synthase II
MERRRVVVTGTGVVSAPGIGTEDFWKGLSMERGPGPHEVAGWDPEPWIPRREARRLDRVSQFALVATQQALEQAGSLTADPDRVAVSIGTGIGGLESLEELIGESYKEDPRVSPLLIPMMMCNGASATISIKYGFGGPATTPVVACAAGAQGIADGLRMVQWGYADAAITGGSEAAIRTPTIAGFASAKALSPSGIARPFDRNRDGFVLGEGSAVLVLEEREMALARGANILGEVLGASATADAHHITAPHPQGVGAERAIRLALQDAGVAASDVTYINAHGTGTELNDKNEGEVIVRLFGDHHPPVSSIKAVTGHALGASGALEAVASLLAISHSELPPNIGLSELAPDIPLNDVVTEPRRFTPGPVISNSFGFGGHNTVLVLGPPDNG